MTIVEFNWLSALSGGVLIGLAAVSMMASIGKIAGVSGIFANVLRPLTSLPWHWAS